MKTTVKGLGKAPKPKELVGWVHQMAWDRHERDDIISIWLRRPEPGLLYRRVVVTLEARR